MSTTTRRRSLLIRPTTAAASSHNEAETDVVIVGAGFGLMTVYDFVCFVRVGDWFRATD
jgi:hypothetical protein